MSDPNPLPPAPAGQDRLRLIAHAVYGLQLLGFFTLITPLIGVILNYVKLEDAAGSLYESHFRWQIRTFWWVLGWSLLAILTWIVFIGMAIMFAVTVWYLYRIIKCWLRLTENRSV